MKYRRLGRTNLKVSVIGIGTYQFGGRWGKTFEQDEATRMLHAARDLGVNLIDTAAGYGDHWSETLIGNAIAGERDRWIIASKFDLFTPEDAVKKLEQSLRALRTDHVDIYQFHSGKDDAFDQPAMWEALQKQVDAGKIRHLGNSISPNTNVFQIDKSPQYDIRTIQIIYNRLNRDCEEAALDACRKHDLGVFARVPLASGFLTGKYQPGERFTDVRQNFKDDVLDRMLAEVQHVRDTEVPDGMPFNQWALAWCLQHPAVTCALVGCKSVEQVQSNMPAGDLDMVRDDHPQAWN